MKRFTKIFSFTAAICLKNVLGKNFENLFFEGAIFLKKLFKNIFLGNNFEEEVFEKVLINN